jgi:hypothetical protein
LLHALAQSQKNNALNRPKRQPAMDQQPKRKFPKLLAAIAILAALGGITLIVYGIYTRAANGLVYGMALLTASALLGLSVMNRMFPKRK